VEQRAAPEESAALVELSAEQLEKKAGVYFDAQHAAVREVRYAGDRLQFQGYDLVPLSEDLFFFAVEPQTRVEFIPMTGSAVTGMKTLTSSEVHRYDRVETISATPNVLAQYAGRYYSTELDVYWTIEAGDNHLLAKRRKYVDSKLTPVFADTFRDDWEPLMGYPTTYFVLFERDERGEVSGLRVSGARVRHVRFDRQRV
jgi:hypothetical protein